MSTPNMESVDEKIHKTFCIYTKQTYAEFPKEEFSKLYSSFLKYTEEAFIGGNLEKPDGTSWASSDEAFQAWADHHKLKPRYAGLFFRAVDDVATYS